MERGGERSGAERGAEQGKAGLGEDRLSQRQGCTQNQSPRHAEEHPEALRDGARQVQGKAERGQADGHWLCDPEATRAGAGLRQTPALGDSPGSPSLRNRAPLSPEVPQTT